jgi:hypothetical protein
MTEKVTVDREYRPVPADSPDAAFSLRADDPRVPKAEAAPEPESPEEPQPEEQPAPEPQPERKSSRKRS